MTFFIRYILMAKKIMKKPKANREYTAMFQTSVNMKRSVYVV
jgi:hypothetical protein